MTAAPFTVEHEDLRARVRGWVDEELTPDVAEWEAAGLFPDEVFHRAGELGFLGLSVPVEDGGQGWDYWASVVFLEEITRASASIAMGLGVQTDMCTPQIRQFGTPEQIERYLKPAYRGEKIGSVGITEPDAGSDVASIRTNAQRTADGWVINGSKMYITNGVRADWVTMVVRTAPRDDASPSSGISLFLVDTDLPGFSVSKKLDKLGMRSSDTALLFLDDVHVPDDALLGVEHEGFKQIMWGLQGERLAGGLLALGGAQRMFEHALSHVQQQANGSARPSSAVRHRLADMATDIEANRQLIYDSCDKWNRGVYARTEIAMVKLAAAQLASRIADGAMEVTGASGYREGSPMEAEWRDSRLHRIGGGSDEVQRQVIARMMGL